MQYKGYVAAVEFDDAVGRHGRVVNSGAGFTEIVDADALDARRRLVGRCPGNPIR